MDDSETEKSECDGDHHEKKNIAKIKMYAWKVPNLQPVVINDTLA